MLGAILVLIGSGYWLAMEATSGAVDSTPFDSPLYVWSWLVLPMTAFLASMARPQRWGWWSSALIGPMALGVVLGESVYHSPENGPSVLLMGMVLVGVQAMSTFASGSLGQSAAHALSSVLRSREPSRTHPTSQ